MKQTMFLIPLTLSACVLTEPTNTWGPQGAHRAQIKAEMDARGTSTTYLLAFPEPGDDYDAWKRWVVERDRAKREWTQRTRGGERTFWTTTGDWQPWTVTVTSYAGEVESVSYHPAAMISWSEMRHAEKVLGK